MPKPLTILLITTERLVRADLRPGGRVSDCQLASQPRPAVDDLPSLVELTLRLNASKPGRVLLLTTELWTQTLPMAAGAAAGMGDDEVASALAFEAEPFSGISAFDSLGICLALPRAADEPQFWFTQMAGSQRELLEYVVSEAGGKLTGIAHPAGLPVPLHESPPSRWERIELWPDAVVCLRRDGRAPAHVHIINTSPQSLTWQQDAQYWLGQFDSPEVRETLVATDRAVLDGAEQTGAERLDLADEAVMTRWLLAWAEQSVAKRSELPILRPAPKPMPASTRFAIAGLIGVVMLSLCLGHYRWTVAATQAANERVAELRRPAEELKKAQTEADNLQRQLTTLTAQVDRMQASVDACLRAMEWNRQRMAQLMTALAASDPDSLVIQAIETRREGIRVRGISRRPEHPNQLAARLAEQLRPLGLQVSPPSKEAGFLLADGSPYLFELLIQDISHLGQPLGEPEPAGSQEDRGGAATNKETAAP
jgi:Tfp pilus assembly protein PilN